MHEAVNRGISNDSEIDVLEHASIPDRDTLIKSAIDGEPEAMHALVVQLIPRVRNLVRYLVRGDTEVDDIAQDSLVTVMRRLGSFRGEGKFESWVDGVVLRVTLFSLRKHRIRLLRFASQKPEALSNETQKSPESYPDRRRTVAALDTLPDKQRHVLVMHYVLGMTVPEISKSLDVPIETVRSRLRIGMSHLRVLLDIDCEEQTR